MITYSCGAWDSDMFTYYKTSEKTLIYSVPTTHLPFISLHSEDVRTKLFNAGEAVKRRLEVHASLSLFCEDDAWMKTWKSNSVVWKEVQFLQVSF